MNDQKKVIIINYGLGNLHSVAHACKHVGLDSVLSNEKHEIENAKALILPGVGSFGEAMKNLKSKDLISPIIDFAQSGKPILGVCLGMQLLFEESEEFGTNKGLGLIKGNIRKFPPELRGTKLKIPQIAWNKIYKPENCDWNQTPLQAIKNEEYMYFVHSFYAKPFNPSNALSHSNYNGFEYCSSAIEGKIFAMQFHPEKSAASGLKIYDNFKNLI